MKAHVHSGTQGLPRDGVEAQAEGQGLDSAKSWASVVGTWALQAENLGSDPSSPLTHSVGVVFDFLKPLFFGSRVGL